MTNWYDLPTYYDVSFSYDMSDELSFLKKVFKKYCNSSKPKLLEPACGTGRLIIPLTFEGFDCSGFDLNKNAISYLENKLKSRNIRANIYYDHDTSWYLDPESTSRLNRVDINIIRAGDDEGYYLDPSHYSRLAILYPRHMNTHNYYRHGGSTFETDQWHLASLHFANWLQTFSDRRAKKDIEYIDSKKGLDIAMNLKPTTFRKKEFVGQERDRIQYGFIAQDVQDIFPEAVRSMENNKDEVTLSLTESVFMPIQVEALKAIHKNQEAFSIDLDKSIERLSKENQELKVLTERLEAKLQQLKVQQGGQNE